MRDPTNARIFNAVLQEVAEARGKFPGNKHTVYALLEESGEVVQAMMNQYHYDKNTLSSAERGDKMRDLNNKITKELIQTMAMCVLILTHGDEDFPYNPNGQN